jgi:hypothetical protein
MNNMQVSSMYGIGKAEWVYAHQLWAACTLYQATNKTVYWKSTEDIYTRWIRPDSKAAAKARLLSVLQCCLRVGLVAAAPAPGICSRIWPPI